MNACIAALVVLQAAVMQICSEISAGVGLWREGGGGLVCMTLKHMPICFPHFSAKLVFYHISCTRHLLKLKQIKDMGCFQISASSFNQACYSLSWCPYVNWLWAFVCAMEVFGPCILSSRDLGEFRSIWIIGKDNTTTLVCTSWRDLDAILQRCEKTSVKLEGTEVLSRQLVHVHSLKD